MRNLEFAEGEKYHIFNRGVDKRTIFHDQNDLDRFFKSMQEFNVVEPIGSIYENRFNKENQLGHCVSKSSWNEYAGLEKKEICKKEIILEQFKNFTDYKEFSQTSLEWIKENKEVAKFLIE